MGFKIGDKVIIRRDLEVGEKYGEDCFIGGMVEYLGKEATITSMSYGKYKLDIDRGMWNWTREMLEPIPTLPTVEEMEEEFKMVIKPNYKIGDKVKIKEGLIANKEYDGVTFREVMRSQEGKVGTISDVVHSSHGTVIYYNMEEFGCSWSESMIEPFEEVSDDLQKALELLGLSREEMLRKHERKVFEERINKEYDELHRMFNEYCDNQCSTCKFNKLKMNCFVGFMIEYLMNSK